MFVKPLQTEFPDWTACKTTSIASVNMAMLAILYNVAGTMIGGSGATHRDFRRSLLQLERCWPASRPPVVAGLTAGLLVGVGLGVGYLPPLYVRFKWYPEARGVGSGCWRLRHGRRLTSVRWRAV